MEIIIGTIIGVFSVCIALWQVSVSKSRLRLEQKKMKIEMKELQRLAQSSKVIITQQFIIPKIYLSKLKSAPDWLGPQSMDYSFESGRGNSCILFLSGLGLDNRDFERHLQSFEEYDCLSITVYGFQPAGNSYWQFSINDHINLLCFATKELIKGKSYKSITLVGFSIGADLVLKIAALNQLPIKISRVIALDPNVNEKTLFITKRIATIGKGKSPIDVAKEISNHAAALPLDGWVDIHRYLVEIFSKFGLGRLDFLQNFAEQVVEQYRGESMDYFTALVKSCAKNVEECRLIFSDTPVHVSICNEIEPRLGKNCSCRVAEGKGHFDLLKNLSVSKNEIDLA